MSISWRFIMVGLAMFALAAAETGCTAKAKKAYHLRRADSFFAAEKYDQAEIEYANALRNGPLDSHVIGQLGLIYFTEGRMQRAYPYLLKACELDTNNVAYRLKLGFVDSAFGKNQEARDCANFVLTHDPKNAEAPLLYVQEANSPGEIAAARQTFSKLDPDSRNPAIQVALGTLAFKQKDTKTAKDYFSRALTDDPKFAAAETALGTVYWADGDLTSAVEHFQKAADLSPPRSPRRIQLAQFKAETKDLAGARQILESINQEAPDYLPAMTMLTEIDLQEKKYDDAGAWIDKILARDPDNYDAMSLAGRLKVEQGKLDDAIASLERMTKVYPHSAAASVQLARAYILNNDTGKAEFNLNRALNINSNYTEAAVLLAGLQIKEQNPAPVVASMTRVIQQQPQLVPARLLLADAYRLQGNVNDAIAIYEQVEQSSPQNAEVVLLEASAYAELKENDQAQAAYERALKLAPGNWQAMEGLVNLDLARHQFTTALQRVETELQKQDNSVPLHLMLARIYKASGNQEKAESALLDTIKAIPDDSTAYLLLAQSYLEQNQTPKALNQLNGLLAKQPKNAGALMLLSTIDDQAKSYQAESDILHKVLDSNPNFSPALNNLAYLDSEHLGKLDEAYDLAQRARALMSVDPSTADTLGWVSYLRGMYPAALTLLQESSRGLPRQPDVQYHLGMAYYMTGDASSAQAALQQAMQLDPAFDHHADCQTILDILAINPQTANAAGLATLQRRVADKADDQIALTKLAAVYEQTGQADKAANTYQSLLQINPQSLAANLGLARYYAATTPQKAYDLARTAYKQAPEKAEVQQLTGKLALQTGDYRFAYNLLQLAVQNQTPSPQTSFYYAQAAYSVGKVTDAQQILSGLSASDLTPSQAAESQQLANLIALFYDPAKATAAAGQISGLIKANPNYVPALMVMGIIDEQKGDPSDAAAQYEKALSVYPDFVPAQRQLAIIYSHDASQLARAYTFAAKARDSYPNDPALAKALGLILYQQGDYARAVAPLRAAAQAAPDGETFYYLGSAQFQLKNRTDGKINVQKALDLKLTDEQAQAARKLLQTLK